MSELTKERLEELRNLLVLNPNDPMDEFVGLAELIDIIDAALALRALRDAGDGEVEKLFVNAMHAVGVDESVNPEGCRSSQRSLEELHHLAITRGQQLREAQAEIERLKAQNEKLQKQIDSRDPYKVLGPITGIGTVLTRCC